MNLDAVFKWLIARYSLCIKISNYTDPNEIPVGIDHIILISVQIVLHQSLSSRRGEAKCPRCCQNSAGFVSYCDNLTSKGTYQVRSLRKRS